MTEDADLMVHDLIGRLFEEPEPTHRSDLADGAIAHGMAVTRRRGFAVAGATLGVLGVVAGAFAVSGGGQGSGDWSVGSDTGQISSQAYEDSGPTYADRQREIVEQLPGVLGSVLPAGVTVSPDQKDAGNGVDIQSGTYFPTLMLRSGGTDFRLTFDGAADDAAAYTNAFAQRNIAPVSATGGTIRVLMDPPNQTPSGAHGSSAWYEFTPADKAEPVFRFWIYGDGKASPIDVAAFQAMTAKPGFAKLRQLQDPSVQASAGTVRQRYTIEAKINAEAKTILPPGFRLKLNPGALGGLELVGPRGVNAFAWESLTGSTAPIPCPLGALCYSGQGIGSLHKLGPDGKPRLGLYTGYTGPTEAGSMMLHVFGKPAAGGMTDPAAVGKPGSETAPQGPGLTPQEAKAIITAPGAAKVIADVQNLAAVK